MHSVRFPKTLTIELPELQREALQQICDREQRRTPAELLEAILAVGLASRLASYPPEDVESDVPHVGDAAASQDRPPLSPVRLVLNEEQSGRVFRILKGRPARTPEELASWLLEWGLDAFEESLKIIESQDTSLEVGKP